MIILLIKKILIFITLLCVFEVRADTISDIDGAPDE